MSNNSGIDEWVLLCAIVNFGVGSKVINILKQQGVTGGTVFLGKGTVRNHLLEILDLTDIRKEIVLSVTVSSLADQALEALNQQLALHKPHHGIAFTIPVKGQVGVHHPEAPGQSKERRGVIKPMYNAIFTIVDKGKAEEVVEAGKSAGARGATVINARGSGIHETQKLFAMPIEPEKEIVMILAQVELTDAIVSKIKAQLQIEEPGKGIMFILNVDKTYGLYN
ncbi:MAG TPA: P-II family nitrogen regulator [Firmicutes bacterium]|nr:P-II family nitrogen regulator [Bacillota bacterium]